jgi:hypothetical protein
MKRILSGLVAAGYIAMAMLAFGAKGIVLAAAFLVIPMACIWFSAEMGSFAGTMNLQYVNARSPARLIEVAGWVIILPAPVVAIVVESL